MPTETHRASVVFDASLAIRAAVDLNEQALYWLRAAEEQEVAAVWPELVFVEIAHGLLRLVRAGRIAAEEAGRKMARLVAAPVGVERLAPLVIPAMSVALERSLSVYDATYVVLAERFDARLITADRRLASAVRDSVLISG